MLQTILLKQLTLTEKNNFMHALKTIETSQPF